MRNPTYHRRRHERLRREDAMRSQRQHRQSFMADVRESQREGTRLGVQQAVDAFLQQDRAPGPQSH